MSLKKCFMAVIDNLLYFSQKQNYKTKTDTVTDQQQTLSNVFIFTWHFTVNCFNNPTPNLAGFLLFLLPEPLFHNLSRINPGIVILDRSVPSQKKISIDEINLVIQYIQVVRWPHCIASWYISITTVSFQWMNLAYFLGEVFFLSDNVFW